MPQNKDLEERTEDIANLAGRNLPLKRRGATPTAQTNQESPKGFYNGLKRGATYVAGAVIGLGLMGLAGCATTGSYTQAQQQKPAQQYEEIDYENMNLLYSNRVVGKPDFYNDKAVFSVIIPPANMEIFISNRDGTNQRRLTNTPDDSESCPFETKDGKNIVFRSVNLKKQANKDYIMNKDGTDKKEITEAVYSALAQERGKDLVKDFW